MTTKDLRNITYLYGKGPKGLHCVRHYGLLHPSNRKIISQIQLFYAKDNIKIIEQVTEAKELLEQIKTTQKQCKHCEHDMKIIRSYLNDCSKDPPLLYRAIIE